MPTKRTSPLRPPSGLFSPSGPFSQTTATQGQATGVRAWARQGQGPSVPQSAHRAVQNCPKLSPVLSGDCGHEGPPERLPDSGGRMPIVPGRLFSSCAPPPAYKKDMCTLWQHQLCAQTAARFAGMLGINAETSLQKDLSCVNRSSLDSFLHLPLPEAIAIPFIPWTVCGKKDTVFLSFPFIQEFVLCKDASSSA